MRSAEALLELIRERVDHPATLDELIRLLRVPREGRLTLRRQVRALVADGHLVQTRTGHVGLPERMDLVAGRVAVTTGGLAFVEPDRALDGLTGDVFVAGPDLNEAMHGDRVLVRVERLRRGDRPVGRIVRILERAHATLVGRFDVDAAGVHFVVPFDRRVSADVVIPRGDERRAAPGDMVVAEITRWPTPSRGPVGRVLEVLGHADAPGVDVRIVLRKHGIADVHDERAIEEARRLGTEVRSRDLAGRTDFRHLPIVTIDGEHARDFDDAVSVERLANGHYRLGVHVADVAHYVRPGSTLDLEARARGTSVYFPDRAVHMFPAELATGLCSLRPHVDRLVQSCVMEVDGRGRVTGYELHDGVICSVQRMTYTDVDAILTRGDEDTRARYAELVPVFELMSEVFEILNARRRARGSIDFDLPEPEVLLDTEGLVAGIVATPRNVAHRIIEEFMLLANETVAAHLESQGWPAVYRVHERPDPAKVADLEQFVATLGYTLGAPPHAVRPRHFQQLVERIAGAPEEKPIAFLVLQTLQKARYDVENLGHFGLAAASYTHFTSPIRRYPDLLVHRALREQRAQVPMTDEAREDRVEYLADCARHCSACERRADEAERELIQWKKVRFMAGKVGEVFDGYVTGVAAFGLFVELAEHFVEGLVHVSTLADDYYRFLGGARVLQGESSGRRYRLGDRVSVQVARVDFERRQIDLVLQDSGRRVSSRVPARESRRAGESGGPSARRRATRPGRRERAARRGGRR